MLVKIKLKKNKYKLCLTLYNIITKPNKYLKMYNCSLVGYTF